jgi:hypothetical protein
VLGSAFWRIFPAMKSSGLVVMLLLSGCVAPAPQLDIDANTIMFNNFEGGGGWSSDPNRNDASLIMKGLAHSGQYALRVDQNHEFSLTFDLPLGKISPSKFKGVHLDAWVFMPSAKATAAIGMQIVQPDGSIAVNGSDIKFGEAIKTYNKWVPVSTDFILPDNIIPAQHLRLFMWRADASEEALLDDVKLSLIR